MTRSIAPTHPPSTDSGPQFHGQSTTPHGGEEPVRLPPTNQTPTNA